VSLRTRAAAPAVLAAVLLTAALTTSLLAGCTAEGTAATLPSPGGSASENSAPSSGPGEPAGDDVAAQGATGTPPFPADTEADTAEASSDALVSVSDIRIGRHDGFDRVVLEAGGRGEPGWDVRYVDQASSQGSGDPVGVAGDAVLQVTLTGAGPSMDTGIDEVAWGRRVAAEGTEAVTEVVYDGMFEGTAVAFVGTTAKEPFRVYLLESPARVVLEVAHDD
jgi:hypothetical protein